MEILMLHRGDRQKLLEKRGVVHCPSELRSASEVENGQILRHKILAQEERHDMAEAVCDPLVRAELNRIGIFHRQQHAREEAEKTLRGERKRL